MATPLRGRINIHMGEKVTLENLNAVVAQIAGMAGCTHCGLLGIDLRLTGDPVEAQQLAKLPGVSSVIYGE